MYILDLAFPSFGTIRKKKVLFFINYPVSPKHGDFCLESYLMGGGTRKIRRPRPSPSFCLARVKIHFKIK